MELRRKGARDKENRSGEEGAGKGAGLLQRQSHTGSSVLRALSGDSGGSQENFHQLSRYVLSDSWSPLIGQC